MIRLCIFDIDGTIADTIDDLKDSVNRSLKVFGIEGIETERCKEVFGGNIAKVISDILKEKGNKDTELTQKVLEYHLKDYANHIMDKTKPFKGVVEEMRLLEKKGVKLCIVSNKPDDFAFPIINRYFSDIDFEYIIGADSDFENKPSPDGVNYVMRKLNVSPEETVYIGDSEVDIKTGKNAKVKTIGVSWGFRGKEILKKVGADYLISYPHEINKILAAG